MGWRKGECSPQNEIPNFSATINQGLQRTTFKVLQSISTNSLSICLHAACQCTEPGADVRRTVVLNLKSKHTASGDLFFQIPTSQKPSGIPQYLLARLFQI